MRVESHIAARELHPIAALASSERIGRRKKLSAYSLAPVVGAHVHALKFTAPSTGVLKVGKDHDLTDAHYFVSFRRDQDVPAAPTRFFDCVPIPLDAIFILEPGRERTALNDQRRRSYVVSRNGSNDDVHELARINRREDSQTVLDGVGRVQAQVFAKEVTDHLHADRQALGQADGHARRG